MPVLRLEIILGCMFAGKSSELIRRANRLKSIDRKVLLINHEFDTRTSENVKTHDDVRLEALKVGSLMPIINDPCVKEADAICIDEGQFFNDLYEFVAAHQRVNKTIIVSSLNGDRNMKPFGQALSLIPMCDDLVMLHAIEKLPDGRIVPAPFSMLVDKCDGDGIIIGAKDKYKAVSRETHLAQFS